MRHRITGIAAGLAVAALVWMPAIATAQIVQRPGMPPELVNKLPQAPLPPPEPNFIIGADDVLLITVWGEKDLTGEVRVRPDGKITMSVGNDIVAQGLTVEQLKEKVAAELKSVVEEPTVFIQVREINSRMVFITGAVNKPGPYRLIGPMTVLQLITAAGGLQPFAKKKSIMIVSATEKTRTGQPVSYKINYADLEKGKNVARNNPLLRPGDQVIVGGGD